MDLQPAKMARLLIENASKIEALTNKIIDIRNILLLADAEYMDAVIASYKTHVLSLSPSASDKLSKIDAIEQWKKREKVKTQLRILQDKLNVLESSNNNLKMSIKLLNTEITNLNL